MPFFFNDTATTEIYTLSLHDALPISSSSCATASGIDDMGGPDMGPQTPQRSGRPGEAMPPLDNYASGGRRSAQGCAVSKAAAARSTPASSRQRPAICSPTGRPDFVKPAGTEIAGRPTTVNA